MSVAYATFDVATEQTSLRWAKPIPRGTSGREGVVTLFPGTQSASSVTAPPDSPPKSRSDEAAYEEDVRGYVSRLWAEDWDSPEDAVYDTW